MSGLSLSISLAGGGDMAVGWRLSPSSYVSMCQKLQQRSLSRSFPIPSFSLFSAGPRTNLQITASVPQVLTSTSLSTLSLSGLEDVMTEYISGKRKATEVAHSVWRHIVQKGDTLVDATCGNGYDTLAMVKMIANKSHTGHVYAMDIQQEALKNTSSLLKESLDPDEAKHVELFAICHSKMEEIVPKSATVRLVAFNLGYLPGGDKAIITVSNTTLQALEAAKRILTPAGLISTVVYIGHPGGREEFETVEAFASGLPVEDWICCKLQMSNRPLAPILVLIWKK